MSRSFINQFSRHAFSALFFLGLASAAEPVTAGPITVVNPSFELDVHADGVSDGGPITGWGQTAVAGTYNPTDTYFPNATDSGPGGGVLPAPAAGNQVLFLNSGAVYQDVGALVADTKYTLTVAVGSSLAFAPLAPTIELVKGTDSTGMVLVALTPTAPPQGTFQDFSVSTTTGDSVSGDLTIVFATSGVQPILDNVRLNAILVPEPGSLVLLGLGGIGLAAFVLRRRAGQRVA